MNSKQKGKRGELELAHFLSDRGFPARRGQQFSGGTDSPDVVCPSLGGFHFECKRTEAGNPYLWMEQARRDGGPEKRCVVAHRRNDKQWLAILDLEDFLALVRKAQAVQQEPERPSPLSLVRRQS